MIDNVIPADVPQEKRAEFYSNYQILTHGAGRLFIFAADHKMEHLDEDFIGPSVDPSAHHPEHFFKIAQKARIGGLATQPGLIARYANQFPGITYIAKLNSKTNLIPTRYKDPFSEQLWSVENIIKLKESGVSISGIGLTIYLGSEFEEAMLAQAAESIFLAHQAGLVAILWMYPRGNRCFARRKRIS